MEEKMFRVRPIGMWMGLIEGRDELTFDGSKNAFVMSTMDEAIYDNMIERSSYYVEYSVDLIKKQVEVGILEDVDNFFGFKKEDEELNNQLMEDMTAIDFLKKEINRLRKEIKKLDDERKNG